MKLYQTADGTFYEKQADVPKGQKFKPVEFAFSASPKADFVAWMNQLDYGPGVSLRIAEQRGDAPDLLDGPPAPPPPPPCRSSEQTQGKADGAFRREVEERWSDQPLPWRLDMGMLAFEDARGRLR